MITHSTDRIHVEKEAGKCMPRAVLIRSETHPYHVTSRSNNKEFFPIPLDQVWKIMMEQLLYMHKNFGLAVHSFVLMGNHFHLLCHTPNGNLDQIMQVFLRATSIKINLQAKSINHLWGGRYKWSLIESKAHYYQVYRYIFQNPVRAGICKRVEEYPYSTLKEAIFPIHSSISMSFGGSEGELIWLNEHFDKEDEELIKLGLRKYQFDVSQRNLKAFNRLSLPKKPPVE
jgi:putative transposase